jgi:hypothetical protein
MKTPNYEETRAEPLTTDALVTERVEELIGRAIQHQLWFLFLDVHQVQLPLVIPVGELPARPDAFVGTLAQRLAAVAETEAAGSVIVVIERFAQPELTAADREWAKCLHDALDENGVAVRGVLLSHSRGVRWVAQDDYRF